MPFVISGARKGGRIAALAVGLGLACAAPATATTVAANPYGCVVDHRLSTPFSQFGDTAFYALAPAGNFETAARGWTLTGGSVVSGNQPFKIGAPGTSSLRLAGGGVAVSAPMCIDSTYPHFRVFARNLGNLKSPLKAEVLYLDAKGAVRATASGTVTAAGTAWFPTDSLKIGLTFNTAVAAGAAPVAFRFTAGKDSAWQIDDVYVDPYARR